MRILIADDHAVVREGLKRVLSGMPEAVRITLSFDPNPKRSAKKAGPETETTSEPAMTFETTVRLNLTAASQSGFDGRDQNGQDKAADNPGADNQ